MKTAHPSDPRRLLKGGPAAWVTLPRGVGGRRKLGTRSWLMQVETRAKLERFHVRSCIVTLILSAVSLGLAVWCVFVSFLEKSHSNKSKQVHLSQQKERRNKRQLFRIFVVLL